MSYIGNQPTTAAFPFDQFSGNGTTTSFTLTYAPASTTSIIVSISGVVQNPNTYSVVGQTLNFSPAPPSGTNNIAVLYLGLPVIGTTSPGNTAYMTSTQFTATAGQTTFTPSGAYQVGFVNVIRNGSQLAPSDFTATNGTTVVLNNACVAGDTVVIQVYTLTSLTNALPVTGGTMTGSLSFSGNGLRITGDFSNATTANRVMFQNSVTNGSSYIQALPNGTSTQAGLIGFNSSDANNSSFVQLGTTSTDVRLSASLVGTGTYLPMTFYTGGSERMRIDTSGNVGIGRTDPSNFGKLAVMGTIAPVSPDGQTQGVFLADNTGKVTVGGYNGSGTNFIAFNAGGGTERARIDSSGNLLVGKASSSQISDPGVVIKNNGGTTGVVSCVGTASTNAADTYHVYSTGAAAYRFYVEYGGQVRATVTSIAAISDVSLKENIRDLETGLTQVMALRPRRFDWKEETQLGTKDVAGFIAQEVEQVLPDLVSESKYSDDVMKKSVRMGDMLPTLVKAIQELKAELDEAKAEIAALKGA